MSLKFLSSIASAFVNGALQNGVSQIVSASKPLTRPDGSPLVDDDRLYNTADNLDYYRSGNYWLSQQIFSVATLSSATVAATGSLASFSDIPFNPNAYDLFLRDWSINARIEGAVSPGGATDSATSYYVFGLGIVAGGSTYTALSPAQNISFQNATYSGSNRNVQKFLSIASFYDWATVDDSTTVARRFAGQATKTGTPPNFTNLEATLTYQLVLI